MRNHDMFLLRSKKKVSIMGYEAVHNGPFSRFEQMFIVFFCTGRIPVYH